MNNRAGRYVKQIEGYKSFVPKSLPPDPPLQFDMEMIALLSEADRALGKLDGITETLPNPNLFVSMYVKKEALLSSQIEGTQASLVDVLETEERQTQDAREVTNYVRALNYGISRLENDGFPLCLRLIREVHHQLLASGRGSDRSPGEFRHSQNWIGGYGSTIENAAFVPPIVDDMTQALRDLELYFYEEDSMPPLVKIALIHAQFETIHPFLDGNGRMGRLLITLYLCQQHILSQPLLYLSYYFKRNRSEYYDRLMDVRNNGAWEEWVKFFLRGIVEVSEESSRSAHEIDALRERLMAEINAWETATAVNAHRLLDLLFATPRITREGIVQQLGISSPSAGALIEKFIHQLNVLVDLTPERSRRKQYAFQQYLSIIGEGTE